MLVQLLGLLLDINSEGFIHCGGPLVGERAHQDFECIFYSSFDIVPYNVEH